VNFLLHRHLAEAELGSAAAGVGAMLPDLWRMAHRRARAPSRTPLAAGPGAEGATGELLRGIEHHLEADRWFHEGTALADGEAALSAAIERSGCVASRMSLLVHPLWEMCLDGALVRQAGLGPLLASLEASLGATSGARAEAATVCGLDARLGPERGAFDERMSRLCDAVVEGAWVGAYGSASGLALCLDGIRRRVGLEPLDLDQRARLAEAIASVEGLADRTLGALLAARRG
jgi:hypothetical protein